jgi:hypothetical protein
MQMAVIIYTLIQEVFKILMCLKVNNLNNSISIAFVSSRAPWQKTSSHSANYLSNSTYHCKWQINLCGISMEQISAHNFYTNKNVFPQKAAWSVDHYRIFQKNKSLTRISISLCMF